MGYPQVSAPLEAALEHMGEGDMKGRWQLIAREAHPGRIRCRGEGGDWGYKSPLLLGLGTEGGHGSWGRESLPQQECFLMPGYAGASTQGERLQWWPCLLHVTQWCFTFM